MTFLYPSHTALFKKIRSYAVALFLVCAMIVPFSAPIALASTLQGDVTSQLTTTGNAVYNTIPVSLGATVGNIIKALLGLLGVIAVILIIYAGVLWMTAQGESEKVDKAKDILREAIIGLVIIFLAYGIASFAVNAIVTTSGATGP